MGKSGRKYLFLAVVFAAIATLLVYRYLSNSPKATNAVATQKVVVANQLIPAKTTVTKHMVKEVEVPKTYITPKAVIRLEDVVGKITTDRIMEGEQLVAERFSNGKTVTLAFRIPEKHRAVTIAVDEIIGVANLIKPGDYVDILVTLEKEEIETTNQIILYPKSTKIILQNLQILAIGQDMRDSESVVDGLPKSVTLAVLPEDAEKLVLAEEMGRLRLALRRVEDEEYIETPGANREDISNKKGYIEKQKNTGSGPK
jgi:pilus assembly protein CpaB